VQVADGHQAVNRERRCSPPLSPCAPQSAVISGSLPPLRPQSRLQAGIAVEATPPRRAGVTRRRFPAIRPARASLAFLASDPEVQHNRPAIAYTSKITKTVALLANSHAPITSFHKYVAFFLCRVSHDRQRLRDVGEAETSHEMFWSRLLMKTVLRYVFEQGERDILNCWRGTQGGLPICLGL
jgi:hypothetical protein